MKNVILAGLALALASLLPAVELASPFGDHMVLQRDKAVPVWGWGEPGETVEVAFAGQTVSTKVDAAGKWRLTLAKLATSAQPRVFEVKGERSGELALSDVLVGEVWLCGGQSNMERQLGLRNGQKPIMGWEEEVAAANYPEIRQLYVKQTKSMAPQETVTASWSVCRPESVVDFTAVGYFFARDLYAKLKVPVGIIHSSWGGTPAEAWTGMEGLKAFPEFGDGLEMMKRRAIDPEGADRSFREALADWYAKMDPGSGEAAWSRVDLDTSEWETMRVPAMWEDAGHEGFDGIAWFRKSFDLSVGFEGQDLELNLGVIDDFDTTWVNGIKLGETSGYMTERVYRVPADSLKAAGNVIAVRALDTGGGGGLWNPDFPLRIHRVGDSSSSLSLNGDWQIRFGPELKSGQLPPADFRDNANAPTVLYNAMIAPLIPYAMRGVAFYQGEANATRSLQYRSLFPAMIKDWRRRWGQGDFPFLFVQIAPYEGQPPEIREAQLLAWKATKNTAMAVTIDVGDAKDIHPADKSPVGERLALAARALAYGEAIQYSGPVFEKLKVKGSRAVLKFDQLGGGLVAKDGPLYGFLIAGKDGVFHEAVAKIEGDTVIVTSTEVAKPEAVRYGWANVAAGNLFNTAGLPASPFRTDVE